MGPSVWFREIPQSLFNVIPEKHIYLTCKLQDPKDIMETLNEFPALYRSIVLWLLDLMVEVVQHKEKNKMSAKCMAIVMSPNLFSIESDNPMYALTMSQKVADYTFALLSARLALAHQDEAEHDAR
uniref:Rho-GAP domain-containing protein n=1 Tax=Globisporangium ultimum (strain ATCC 200006 / CBS 805.95 / DAOM BR144) TaxID=431595 RepID=K3WX47_GLOUD